MMDRSRGDPRIAAESLLAISGSARSACFGSSPASDIPRLMAAIQLVERQSRTAGRRLAEDTIVRGALALGLPVPDFSLGDGQVRVSTALEAAKVIAPDLAAGGASGIAARLLEPCANRDIGVVVLKWLDSEGGPHSAQYMAHDDIVRLAKAYNGQSPSGRPDAALANAFYAEVVYQLYMSLAFEDARRGQRRETLLGHAPAP